MGSSGAKFPVWKALKAMTTKKSSTRIFTNTSTVFTVADSLAPRISRTMARATTRTAGTLNRPPSAPGGLVSAAGRSSWKTPASSLTYSPAPTAIAATETPYSSSRHQPQIQARPSPTVA